MKSISKMFVLGCMFAAGLFMFGGNSNASTHYHIHATRAYDSRIIRGSHHRLFKHPGVHAKRKVGWLAGQLMQINEVAKSHSKTYFKVSRKGHNYGWINAKYLHKTSTYVLPYTYNSQLYPTFAPNACEAIGLKMALSVKGAGMGYTSKFIARMPRNKNPHLGFRGNPFMHNNSHPHVSWTIYPGALAKYGKRYDHNTEDIRGASRLKLISEVKHGNAVAFAAARDLSGVPTGHTLVMVGYKYGAFLLADPYKNRHDGHKVFWASTTRVMHYYNRRGRFAVTVR